MTLGHRPELDGLRTVAVYLVLLFHAGLAWTAGGFIGVDLFFVLSGFLVAGVLLHELDTSGSVRLAAFYARRVRRLLPAAIVVVVATSLGFTLLWSVVDRLTIVPDARSSLLYYANWHFLAASRDYFAADAVAQSPFLHFWSLSIEEQYYLVFPALLLALARLPAARRRKATVAVIGLVLIVSLALQVVLAAQGDTDRAYYGTDTRLYQLLAGALLASWQRGTPRRPNPGFSGGGAVIGVIALLVLGSGLLDLTPSTRGVGATLASVLVIAGLTWERGGLLARVLSTRAPVFLGKISYGTYLWHWPVIVALGVLLDASPLAVASLATVMATALAALSYELLEMPIRRSLRLDPFSWQVAAAGIVASAVVATGVVPPLLADERHPVIAAPTDAPSSMAFSEEVKKELEAPVPRFDVEKVVSTAEAGEEHWCGVDDPQACTVVRGQGPHVLLVGDSQAQSFVPVLERLAREHDLTLSVNVVSGCPWQEQLDNVYLTVPRVDWCRESRVGWFEKALPRLDPDVVLLAERPRDDPSYWGTAVRLRDGRRLPLNRAVLESSQQTLRQITKVAPAVVVQRLVMAESFDPVACLVSSDRVGACAVPVQIQPSPSDGDFSSIAAENPDVHPLSLGSVFCPSAPVCLPVVGGTVVWRDNHHYTVSWMMQRRWALWRALSRTGFFG